MHIKKILIAIILSTFMILLTFNLRADDTTEFKEPTYIIKVTSAQPQEVVGCYLALTNTGSVFRKIHQKTPIKVKVTAQTINAMFRVEPTSSFLRVQLYRQKNNKTSILVEEKGHALIVNGNDSPQQTFIVAR